MSRRSLVIVNPASAGGATRRRWPAVEAKLRAALGAVDVEFTRGRRDAERIAREGVRAGADLVVAVGGDGTVGEVTAGLLGAGLGGYAELALLPMGSGGDLARRLGLGSDVEAAIARIVAGKSRPLDAGRVEMRSLEGGPLRTHFANIASVGVSALITRLVAEAPKALGGTASYLLGTLRGLVRWRSVPVTIRVDGNLLHDGPLEVAAVANGSYFGGGMHVAPLAETDDGLFDVIVLPGTNKLHVLRLLSKVYGGNHLDDPGVLSRRGRVVEIDSPDPVWVELDGDPLGMLPARFEVLPGALRLRG